MAKPIATGSEADPQVSIRRDYELALQVSDRGAWEAFLETYPDGFYANLAKGQLRRIAAEEARAAATEKARLAEQEKARLVAEGARPSDQAKAAAAAKAAEEARLAAEKRKQAEQEKAATEEQARQAVEKAAEEKHAALTPADKPNQPVEDLSRALQSELRRVGCNTGAVDGTWDATAQKSLDSINKHAGTKLDVKIASADALDAVKGKVGRVCPVICQTGFRADADRCVKITCRAGYELNNSGICERTEIKKPLVKQEMPVQRPDRSQQQGKTASELTKQFTNSPTCSNIRAACERGVSPSHCSRSFAECMRTGKWSSSFSNYEGLAKR